MLMESRLFEAAFLLSVFMFLNIKLIKEKFL